MLSCIDIANYFLIFVDREEGDSITHLKLQKLLYFAQGVSLTLSGHPLFNEEFKSWTHGPVSQSVYSQFKIFEKNNIPLPGEIDFSIYDREIKGLIYKVYMIYGEHSASYLRNLSHKHLAWTQARMTADNILNNEQIKKDFESMVNTRDFAMTEEDYKNIAEAEDQWWMNYDCGVPSENITEKLTKDLESLKKDKKAYLSELVVIKGF